jgi:hypothetical protein
MLMGFFDKQIIFLAQDGVDCDGTDIWTPAPIPVPPDQNVPNILTS